MDAIAQSHAAPVPDSLRLGLALSGGTARAIVHVGVLKALEEAGVRIDLLAGTSGGALVGSLYAAGIPIARLEELACRVRWRDLAGLTMPRVGLVSSEGIARFIERNTGPVTFDQLRIPTWVVATDLMTGEKVILREGRVGDAVRASCCIPQIYAPVELDGRYLVDGGLVEYVPVETARAMGADLVIAVNARARAPVATRPRNLIQVGFMVIGAVASWNIGPSELLADVVIRPDVSQAAPFDLTCGADLIGAGYEATRAALPQLNDELEKRRGFGFRLKQFFKQA